MARPKNKTVELPAEGNLPRRVPAIAGRPNFSFNVKSVKLSILMAAYNEETTIGLAIEEVLNADCRAFTAPGFSGVTPSISPIGTPPEPSSHAAGQHFVSRSRSAASGAPTPAGRGPAGRTAPRHVMITRRRNSRTAATGPKPTFRRSARPSTLRSATSQSTTSPLKVLARASKSERRHCGKTLGSLLLRVRLRSGS